MDNTIFTLVALITRERLSRADKEDDLTPAEFGAVSIRIVSQILRDRSIVPDREALLKEYGGFSRFYKRVMLKQIYI